MSNRLEGPPVCFRREFFSSLLGPIVRRVDGLRSENSHTPEERQRDEWFELIGEGGSALAMFYLALTGSRKDELVAYNVESESHLGERESFKADLKTVERFMGVLGNLEGITSGLYLSWEGAYYESSTECDDDGCETEYYWDEPRQVEEVGFNHEDGERWSFLIRQLKEKTTGVLNEAESAFDLANGEGVLYYPEHVVEKGPQQLMAILAYGAVGGAFAVYEELWGLFASQGIVERETRIKRRAFLKLLASFGLSLKMRGVQRHFAKENRGLLNEIRENSARVIFEMEKKTGEVVFKEFFGLTPIELRDRLVVMKGISEKVLNCGYEGSWWDRDWQEIKPFFEKLLKEAERSIEAFDEFFSYDSIKGNYEIPEGFIRIIKYLMATREIVGFTRSKEVRINYRHFVDALKMAGSLGLAAVGIETAGVLSDVALYLVEEELKER